MSSIVQRIKIRFEITRNLWRHGVRGGSIALYPIVRRLKGRNELSFRNGFRLRSPREEPLLSLFHEVWVDRHYTIPGYVISSGDTVIDIGANVGTFTLWTANAAPGVRIIAVEPFAPTIEFLRKNLAESKVKNVTVIEACCGGNSGEAQLRLRGPAASHTIYRKDVYGSELPVIAQCRMITLDQLFSDHGVQRCDLLKLDCEGAEYEILFSASQDTLDRVQRIVMEYHTGMNEHTPEALAAELRRLGFEVQLLPLVDEEAGYLTATRYSSSTRKSDARDAPTNG